MIPETAARLLGASEALRESIRASLAVPEEERAARSRDELRAALGDETKLEELWKTGREMEPDEAVEVALGLEIA